MAACVIGIAAVAADDVTLIGIADDFLFYPLGTGIEKGLVMEKLHFFHVSCIKEIQYISGAYVNAELRMHAINDRRLLRVLVQRQCAELATLELEFGGLKYMNLIPLDETYTCEILAAALYFQDGYIYWCDKTADETQDAGPFESILICAERLRWRPTA